METVKKSTVLTKTILNLEKSNKKLRDEVEQLRLKKISEEVRKQEELNEFKLDYKKKNDDSTKLLVQNNMLFDEIKSLHKIIRSLQGNVEMKQKETQTQKRTSSKNKFT